MYKKGMSALPMPKDIAGWKFDYDKGEIEEIAEGVRKSPQLPRSVK